MPGLLGPTNPVPGAGQQPVRINAPIAGETNVQNTPVVDPTRVVRPDARTEQQGSDDASGSLAARYDSNFTTFLQRLRDAQALPEFFLRVLQFQGREVASGIQTGFAEELARFLGFLPMDEGQLREFLQNQIESATRFSGALFDALRSAYAGAPSDLTREAILLFARRYSDFSSTPHLEGRMLRTVEDMADSLPGKWAEQLSELAARLRGGFSTGERAGNLELLRNQLFPLISQYVKMTHDHGRARGLLGMLTLDLARYENGSEEGLLQSLRQLSASGVLPRELGELEDQALLQLLLRSSEFSRASEGNAFADNLAKAMQHALRGEGGANLQEAFHHIMRSVLINESVYMPLQHIMVPMEYNGRLMFSELWVDPDAEQDSRGREGGEKTLRLLIKLDIGSLGAFDLLLNIRDGGVAVQAVCPPAVSARGDEVEDALTGILERNGLAVDGVSVSEMRRPIAVSEAFPKVLERMGGVNVKV